MTKYKSFVIKHKPFQQLLLLALFAVPLDSDLGWHSFSFKDIPNNQYQWTPKKGLKIKVNKSASPLLYPLKESLNIHLFTAKASYSETKPQIPKQKKQGQKGYDDFILRIGLIIKGKQKMSWHQRWLAPQWLIDMEQLLPQDLGIKDILFFTTCQQRDLLKKERTHPLHSLIKETCVTLIDNNKDFSITKRFSNPLEVIGLWIAADGDDTQANFEVQLKELKINYK